MYFTIEIADDWLDVLESLAAQVTAQDGLTPEEVLEQTIFSQIQAQHAFPESAS